jgi:diadenosine tetraphosphate (Ap4A) HIT family hydrolase
MENDPYNFEAIRQQVGDRCFICEMLRGNPEFRHRIFYEDENAVAWLNKYPNVYGYALVAPTEHREAVTGDYGVSEYLALQEVVHRVGEAVRRTVATERLYVLSLGSQQGNNHVHWHLVPLPPGIPFEEQQLAWIGRPTRLGVSDCELAELAQRLSAAIAQG